jgi:gliding motility-associated-like protein
MRILSILIFTACFYNVKAQTLTFIKNKKQWPAKVQFAADLPTGQVFIEKDRLTWKLFNANDLHNEHMQRAAKRESEQILRGHNYQMVFVGVDLSRYVALDQTQTYFNYFLGNDPTKWSGDVKGFGKVNFKNVYPGIDLNFYSSSGALKYDFLVGAGYSPSLISMKYLHVNSLGIKSGKLLIETSIGTVTESIPEAYQIINGKKKKIDCKYSLINNEVFFSLGEYDKNIDLVIDPVVVVSSYSGTESISFGLGLVPDEWGFMYLSSMNITKAYPVTMGAVQTSFAGGYYDCTVSKFNPSGTSKIFSTYIGGNKEELILNCVAQKGELAVFGYTTSDTFPLLANGFQIKHKGARDYFIIKLDSSGKQLIASTYLGGKKHESTQTISNGNTYFLENLGEMIVDAKGNCYVLGVSTSLDYPVTANCVTCYCDSTNFGDLVVTKLNPSLTSVLWSTYMGGKWNEGPAGIIFTRDGNILCAGNTVSNNFPTTSSVLSQTKSPSGDIVLFKMNAADGSLISSTYVPLKSNEMAYRIANDINDNIYVAGSIISPASVTSTPGAYNNSAGTILFLKISPALDQIQVLSKYGYPSSQEKRIEIDAFNVDSCGNIYFGGFGFPGLPVTPDAFKSNAEQYGSMYVGVFKSDFTSLSFASYYGGPGVGQIGDHDDGGLNYFDKRGNFYHATCEPLGWPVTPGAFSNFNIVDTISPYNNSAKTSDAFVKMDLQTFVNVNSSLGGVLKSCSPITATFAASPNFGTVTIVPGDGSPAVNTASLVHTYNVFGVYNAYVIAGTDTTTCNKTDSVRIKIAYGPPPENPLKDTTVTCKGINRILDAKNPGSDYLWTTGENTQMIVPSNSGTYNVWIENGFCSDVFTTQVKVLDARYPMILPNIISPNGDGVNDYWDFRAYSVHTTDFEVFNRWGKSVFKSNDPLTQWNGVNQRGEPLSEGTYFWIINYISNCEPEVTFKEKGFIQIVR